MKQAYELKAIEIFKPCIQLFESIGNKCHTYVRYEAWGKTIASTADELNCQLIVMGTRGMGDLGGLVLGSVSHDVLKYAKVPVVLAKKPV